jgi:predicted nucleotide-binding protein
VAFAELSAHRLIEPFGGGDENWLLTDEGQQLLLRMKSTTVQAEGKTSGKEHEMEPDPKKVFIIHGRNLKAKYAVEQFLQSLDLQVLDFEVVAADLGTAVIGDIVRSGMKRARGIIALFTADEAAFLRPEHGGGHERDEDKGRWQARQNVIFEAGMAYGIAQERTIIAVLGGGTKLFSDLAGVHLTYLSNDRADRSRLREKLIGLKCDVNQRTDAWSDSHRSGDFEACVLPEVGISSPF